jgi:hypothetical protein
MPETEEGIEMDEADVEDHEEESDVVVDSKTEDTDAIADELRLREEDRKVKDGS